MTWLTLILRDFHPPEEASAADRARLARHAVLEQALRHARRDTSNQDWREWLLQHVGLSPALAAGAVAAQLSPQTLAAPTAWLATPVHYVAGLDTVRLHPAGVLTLSEPERQALVADFTQQFAGSSLALGSFGERELLLTAPTADPLPSTADPARFLGRVPSAGMPTGPAAAWLRRLAAEMEMWLHVHPVNEQRAARGQLPVSALWLWGGGRPAPVQARALPRLYGSDLFARGLWQSGGGAPLPLPADFAALGPLEADAIVLLPTVPEAGPTDLGTIERAWLAPALVALDAGRIDGLRLILGRRGFALTRRRGWRWWRGERAWWELLA